MTSASSSGTGLTLDPNDPNDAKIMRRQQAVARKAGRDGLDRAAATRGRADLEAAYDQGAKQAAAAQAPAAASSSPTSKGGAAKGQKGGKGGKGPGKPAAPQPSSKPAPAPATASAPAGSGSNPLGSFKPRSPARLPSRMGDVGGFLTGLAAYTVVVIYIRYGPTGWKGWLSAKFLNKPMATNADGGTGTKPKTANGGSAAI